MREHPRAEDPDPERAPQEEPASELQALAQREPERQPEQDGTQRRPMRDDGAGRAGAREERMERQIRVGANVGDPRSRAVFGFFQLCDEFALEHGRPRNLGWLSSPILPASPRTGPTGPRLERPAPTIIERMGERELGGCEFSAPC